MDYENGNLVDEIITEHEHLASDRGNFESQWLEISERISPNDRNQFQTRMHSPTKGEKRTQFVFDSTAQIAVGRFAAILDSLLTPRSHQWHSLRASDPNLNKDRNVRMWFEEVTRLLFQYRYAAKANFASQNHKNYKSLGCYGTACMYIDELDGAERGLRYRSINLGEIYFAENHQGIIDKAYRYFPIKARQCVQKWKEKTPKRIKDETNPEREFFFIHCVKPRNDFDSSRLDYKGMPWGSYYVSMDERDLIEEGGYHSWAFPASRYEQYPGEVYGRSPAMDVLPAIKTLNEEKKAMLRQAHRVIDPVLLAPDDGVIDAFSLRPGSLNAGGVTADGRPLIHALPTGNLQLGKEQMDEEKGLINDSFLVSIFQILTESPQMTATEVLERTKEKGILLAPTIGRQESEYLGPMIEREIDVLNQQRLIPPMPGLLKEARGQYHIQYNSPLSRAQRSEEAAGLMRTIETALQVVQTTQDPQPLDHFNWDEIVPEIASIQGVPLKWLRNMKDVQAIRAQRSQAQQVDKAIQAGPAAAAMTKASVAASEAQGGSTQLPRAAGR